MVFLEPLFACGVRMVVLVAELLPVPVTRVPPELLPVILVVEAPEPPLVAPGKRLRADVVGKTVLPAEPEPPLLL